MNFPKHAFADKNFHCGYYADGDALEKIVHFRQDTIDDYVKMEADKVTSFRKFITSVFKTPIKWFLLKKSEPYQAYNDKDSVQMNHYFN